MRYYPVAILIFCMIFFSCSKSDNMKLLEHADAVIEDDAESSMRILKTVNRNALNDEESAYYALLYTQAQIKNWVEVDSDTLISQAYHYYKDRDEGDRTIRALFYTAKVAYNRGDLRASVGDALAAYEFAKNEKNAYWIAKTSELLSSIFFDVYNFPQAEEYSKIAIDNYVRAGKVKKQRFALGTLGYILINEGRERAAVEMLDSLIYVCSKESPVDYDLLEYLRSPYLEGLLLLDSLDAIAPSTIQTVLNENDTVNDQYHTLIKSWILQQQNNYQEAQNTLNQALVVTENEADYANLLYEKYLNAVKAENFKEASIYTDSLIVLQSNVAKDLLFNSVEEQKSRFYKNRSDISKLQKESTQKVLYITIIFSSCAILLLLIIYSLILKNKKIKIENTLSALIDEKYRAERLVLQRNKVEKKLKNETAKVNKLKIELDFQQRQADRNSLTVQSLFRNQWKTLNMLCDEYYEKFENENTRKVILKNIEKEIDKQRSEESLKKIEDSVNSYMNDIMNKLRSECHNLNEDEYIFVMLNYAGFSIRAICLLNNIKYKTFHNKKSRVVKKIQQSGSPNTHKFTSLLL